MYLVHFSLQRCKYRKHLEHEHRNAPPPRGSCWTVSEAVDPSRLPHWKSKNSVGNIAGCDLIASKVDRTPEHILRGCSGSVVVGGAYSVKAGKLGAKALRSLTGKQTFGPPAPPPSSQIDRMIWAASSTSWSDRIRLLCLHVAVTLMSKVVICPLPQR